MKRLKQLLWLVVLVGAGWLGATAAPLALRATTNNAPTITGADRLIGHTLSTSASISTELANQPDNAVVSSADSLRFQRLTAPTGALQAALNALPDAVLLSYAERLLHEPLVAPPHDLQGKLDQVTGYTAVSYAELHSYKTLSYPLDIIVDTDAPAVSSFAGLATGGTADLSWTSSEFSKAIVRYGKVQGGLP